MKYNINFLLLILVTSCTYGVIETPETCSEEIVAELIDITNTTCASENGSFEIKLLNENINSSAFSYSLNDSAPQSSPQFNGLAAGSYNVIITDGVCESSLSVEIENLDGLSAEIESTLSQCGEANGSLEISFAGSTGEVTFSLDQGQKQSEPLFSSLQAGDYMVTVEDEAGCKVEINAQVENESNYGAIETIVNNSCALSGCHAGNVNPDFRQKSNILEHSDRILARTSAKTMPPVSSGMTLEQNEIDEIQCWVESGAQG